MQYDEASAPRVEGAVRRRCPCLLLLALAPFATGAAKDGSGYEVVNHLISLKAMPQREFDNVEPWLLADQAPDEVIVSNGCGVVTAVYSAAPLGDYLAGAGKVHWSVVTHRAFLGEWCETAAFEIDRPTLAEFRIWKGVRYLIRSARISTDGGGPWDPYVSDQGFIADYESRLNGPKSPAGGPCCAKRMYLRELLPPAERPGPNSR